MYISELYMVDQYDEVDQIFIRGLLEIYEEMMYDNPLYEAFGSIDERITFLEASDSDRAALLAQKQKELKRAEGKLKWAKAKKSVRGFISGIKQAGKTPEKINKAADAGRETYKQAGKTYKTARYGIGAVAAAATLALAAKAISIARKSYNDKIQGTCRALKDPTQQRQCKIKAVDSAIAVLNREASKCKGDDKCRSRIENNKSKLLKQKQKMQGKTLKV